MTCQRSHWKYQGIEPETQDSQVRGLLLHHAASVIPSPSHTPHVHISSCSLGLRRCLLICSFTVRMKVQVCMMASDVYNHTRWPSVLEGRAHLVHSFNNPHTDHSRLVHRKNSINIWGVKEKKIQAKDGGIPTILAGWDYHAWATSWGSPCPVAAGQWMRLVSAYCLAYRPPSSLLLS